MSRHTFNFLGGDELTTMGACWFVSYCYFDLIDNNHMNWSMVKTCANRRSVYDRTSEYFKGWLLEILDMSDADLDKNTLKLKAADVKRMASELLKKF